MGITRLKSRCQWDCAPHHRLWGRITSRLVQFIGGIQLYVVVKTRSVFPSWLLAKGHSQFFRSHTHSLTHAPFILKPVTNVQVLIFFAFPSATSLSLSSVRKVSSILRTYVITLIIQDDLPILRFITLLLSVDFLLPSNLTYSQIKYRHLRGTIIRPAMIFLARIHPGIRFRD